MKVNLILIKTGVLRTASKELVKELEDSEIRGQANIIQATDLLVSAKILKRVLEASGNVLSPKLYWKINR